LQEELPVVPRALWLSGSAWFSHGGELGFESPPPPPPPPTCTYCKKEKKKELPVLNILMQGEKDDKIIAVCADDPEFRHYKDIKELPPHRLAEIRRFFEDCILSLIY
jgi:hypothetical protein